LDANSIGFDPWSQIKTLPDELGALADRHNRRQELKRGICGGEEAPHLRPSKKIVVIDKKEHWLNLQLSRLRLISWRIVLTIVFFCLKETIRFLD
jgi:hypothetical protein